MSQEALSSFFQRLLHGTPRDGTEQSQQTVAGDRCSSVSGEEASGLLKTLEAKSKGLEEDDLVATFASAATKPTASLVAGNAWFSVDALAEGSLHGALRDYQSMNEELLQRATASPGEMTWIEQASVVGDWCVTSPDFTCEGCEEVKNCRSQAWAGASYTYCRECWESWATWCFQGVESACGVLPHDEAGQPAMRWSALQPSSFVSATFFQSGKGPYSESSQHVALFYLIPPNSYNDHLTLQEFLELIMAAATGVASCMRSSTKVLREGLAITVLRVPPVFAEDKCHPGLTSRDANALLTLCIMGKMRDIDCEVHASTEVLQQARAIVQHLMKPETTGVAPSLRTASSISSDHVIFLHHRSPEKWVSVEKVLAGYLHRLQSSKDDGAGCDSITIESVIEFLSSLRTSAGLTEGGPANRDGMLETLQRLFPPDEQGSKDSLRRTMAFSITLIMDVPSLFSDGLPILRRKETKTQNLTRRQCAALIIAGICGLVPDQSAGLAWARHYRSLPSFDFSPLLEQERAHKTHLTCFMNYLKRLSLCEPAFLDEEFVSFSRQRLPGGMAAGTRKYWLSDAASRQPLVNLRVFDEKSSIEDAEGALHADFANRYLGGGVMHGAPGQEESRFAMSPECVAGLLFVERMLDDEAIVIVGAVKYNNFAYWWSTDFLANEPALPEVRGRKLDRLSRRDVHIVAFDAINYRRADTQVQYKEAHILRELAKVSVACLGDPHDEASTPRAFATGNWGSGAFAGDPELKSLIQWLAASMAKREVWYYPFGDERLNGLAALVDKIKNAGLTVAQLYKMVCNCLGDDLVFEQVSAMLDNAAK